MGWYFRESCRRLSFLEENLNGKYYLDVLYTNLPSYTINILGHDENLNGNELVFHQNGAPPHYVTVSPKTWSFSWFAYRI